MKRTLTDAAIRAFAPPATGRIEIADGACRCLELRVTANGAKSFAFRYRVRGSRRTERITLGPYPDLSLRDARIKADKLRGQCCRKKPGCTQTRSIGAELRGAG